VIVEIAEATTAEVDTAVDSAHHAQKNWWRKSSLERAEILNEIANELLVVNPRLAEALKQ